MLHAQEILNLKKRLNEIYVKHTGQPLKKIEDALERDTFLTAEGAKEFGTDRQGDRKAAGGTADAAQEPERRSGRLRAVRCKRGDLARFVPFRCRNRHGNSLVGVRPGPRLVRISPDGRESIVNEFLIVRPVPCFVSIERNVRVVRKGMLVLSRL